jgi:multicomponent Na+:H+ antiporter subunit A
MIACLLLYGVVGVGLLAFGARLRRVAFLVGAIAPAVSFVWVLSRLSDVTAGRYPEQTVTWVPEIGLTLDFRLDGLGATMTLIIGGVGVLILLYSASYFRPDSHDLGRLAGLLVLFGGAMVTVVQADHLLLLYVGWELTSITSYLLIGHHHGDARARAAALQALLVTGGGGLAMLGGFVILGQQAGTYRISQLLTLPIPVTGALVTAAVVLVLLGAFTKSAQYPFHAWLPGAMAAPTPVSAYLHSATMVKAGVYLIALLTPIYSDVDVWRPLVLTVGSVTLVAAGLRAMRQHDLKLLLAFGTVAQLGLLVVLFGIGTPEASAAGWVLLVAHALFKAALFMVVGVLDRLTDTRDIRLLPALDRRWRGVEVTAAVSVASMASLPFLLGFIGKEAGYAALTDGPFTASGLVLAAIVVGSMITVAYGARFYWGAFVTPRRRAREDAEATVPATPRPAPAFIAPAAVLGALSIVLGVAPALADSLVTASVSALYGTLESVHLALWHGLNLPLLLSAVTLAGGVVLVLLDRPVQRVLAVGGQLLNGEEAYLIFLRALGRTARRVTGIVQNGSLPVYSGVILATAAIFPIVALTSSWDWPGWPTFGTVGDVPVAGVLLVAAMGAATVRRRFSAALFLGGAGYAMAGLFVAYGAPDLALTQVAVETLSTVVFVLVLRRLPERFERTSTSRRRAVRLGIAALVGVTVFVFALVASGSGPDKDVPLTVHETEVAAAEIAAPDDPADEPTVSEELVDRSVPDGHGRNVVNVILVDFRGLDTLGEITVLASAAIGAVALARVGRRAADGRTVPPAAETRPDATVQRIVFVDVSVQIIFYAVVVASLWLLFAGHNDPGGGFVGGLLAGSAIALRYVAGGIGEVRSLSRFRPWTVLGTGLLISTLTAATPLLFGGALLDIAITTVRLPVIGTFDVSTALLFDVGVYVTVIGIVLMAFEAFGDEPAGVAR